MKREGMIARGALSLMVMTMMAGTAEGVVKVHTLGDSTMAPYDESATVTRGWGMYVQQFLSDAKAINYARGGRDARGGLEELWPTAKKAVEEGDYVIISFGHNDEKNSGMDGVELRTRCEKAVHLPVYVAVVEAHGCKSNAHQSTVHELIVEKWLR